MRSRQSATRVRSRRPIVEDVVHASKSVVGIALSAVAIAFSAAASAVTSSVMVPVDGFVLSPGSALESVALTGRMHLVTQYPNDPCSPTDPCKVFFDLADVKGVDLPSGNSYVAIGSVNASCSPGDPCFPSFTILPVSTGDSSPAILPNPIMPITFAVRIAFDASGHVSTEGTVVQLPGCTRDVAC
jgi:hypothetical protein